ncbi:thioesterase II family protein [Chitinophaga sp. RAB17]|uniref:thioesterase II family protein n=1 Tax=Chitinophaga sp. RAB17 TaxID=3233049 RepID=UPI003F8F021F
MKKPQLFLLHFAGGNCYSFQELASLLKDFEVISLELPGRGRRIGESLLRDFDLAALDFYNQIIKRVTSPHFLIYGHSMGAFLGLTVSGMLEKAGRPPAYLFVSGNAGPGVQIRKKRYELASEAFVQELLDMGGAPEEFIKDKELFDFFEPILRADFEIVEKNEIKIEPAISAPLYAIMGSEEEYVEQIANWRHFTRSKFNCEIMEGGHFFIHKHPEKIAGIIRDSYRNIALLRHS